MTQASVLGQNRLVSKWTQIHILHLCYDLFIFQSHIIIHYSHKLIKETIHAATYLPVAFNYILDDKSNKFYMAKLSEKRLSTSNEKLSMSKSVTHDDVFTVCIVMSFLDNQLRSKACSCSTIRKDTSCKTSKNHLTYALSVVKSPK